MSNNNFLEEIRSLPGLISPLLVDSNAMSAELVDRPQIRDLEHIYLVGCGDSYHAGLCSEMLFRQETGLDCRALTSMAFARYELNSISWKPERTLVVAVSASGRVSRTLEALELARKAGMFTVAVAADKNSPLAEAADFIFQVKVPSIREEDKSIVVPGCRSFIASLLALYSVGMQLGRERSGNEDSVHHKDSLEPALISKQIAETISLLEEEAKRAAVDWQEKNYFIYCGAGPSYGSACYSAAKILEASGTAAFAQDLEEWAHLQYFDGRPEVPTIVISADGRDSDRAAEIIVAAEAIGCDVAVIAPKNSSLVLQSNRLRKLLVSGPINEALSPLMTSIPGMLFAAYHSQHKGEKYFRNFGGGRSIEGGGGISRIQSSHRQSDLRR